MCSSRTSGRAIVCSMDPHRERGRGSRRACGKCTTPCPVSMRRPSGVKSPCRSPARCWIRGSCSRMAKAQGMAGAFRRSPTLRRGGGLMRGVSRDLTDQAYWTTVRFVRLPAGRTGAGGHAIVHRFNFRYRLEKLVLFAALRRGRHRLHAVGAGPVRGTSSATGLVRFRKTDPWLTTTHTKPCAQSRDALARKRAANPGMGMELPVLRRPATGSRSPCLSSCIATRCRRCGKRGNLRKGLEPMAIPERREGRGRPSPIRAPGAKVVIQQRIEAGPRVLPRGDTHRRS